ncbi:MAG TPA: transcription antitermination factor NusB, partial [Bauldia sp.]|nr:transcription antitermination factor NusB [Bauldia sp.]
MGLSSRSKSPPKARPFAPGLAVREVAVGLLSAVLDRRQSLDTLFDPATGDAAWRALPERDRRLGRAILTTALRHHGEIESVLRRLIDRPPRRAGRLFRILETAAAQLLYMDVPDHAAVSVAMEQVTADRDALHFKGLANAVLRRIGR